MLAFLAVTGHAHARAVLANLLWPDADPERSRSALRRTLSTLRSALGDERLAQRPPDVALDPRRRVLRPRRVPRGSPPTRTPASTRSRAAARSTATSCWPGSRCATASSSTTGCARRRRRFAASARPLLDRLADALAGDGPLRRGDRRARAQRLALDSLHEPTHRRLIELYARAGRRGDALVAVPRVRARARPRARRGAAARDDRALQRDQRRRAAGGDRREPAGAARRRARRSSGATASCERLLDAHDAPASAACSC